MVAKNYKDRLAVCKACELFTTKYTCKECKCFMPAKVLLVNAVCPKKKW
jgi:hypothetical protein